MSRLYFPHKKLCLSSNDVVCFEEAALAWLFKIPIILHWVIFRLISLMMVAKIIVPLDTSFT